MKILVLYYSQTGQIFDILKQLTSTIPNADIDYVKFETQRKFPYPWNVDTFFDTMPECHLMIPEPIMDLEIDMQKNYDLVLLGYQPWFLAPSLPTTSFLHSKYASVLKGKKIVTVIGCRNMWLRAQEHVKARLQEIGAHLVGNIVFEDKHGNMASTLSIIRWLFKAQKEAKGWVPAAGVSPSDIKDAARFGHIISRAFESGNWAHLQNEIIASNGVLLHPNLVMLEGNGARSFPKFAHPIRAKGLPGDPSRKPLVNVFKYLLIVSIFLLSPITALLAKVKVMLQKKKMIEDVAYFKSVGYLPNKI